MLNPQAIQSVQQYLAQFAATDKFESSIESIYGTKIGSAAIRQQWLNGDFSLIPEIRVVSNGELGTANGAYAADLDEILVSADFLAQHQDDPAAVVGLLLEEVGHKIDRVLNGNIDSPGDEGAIFRSLVTGQSLSLEMLAGLRAQDDFATITLDGKQIEIERQDFTGTGGNDTIVGTAGNDNINSKLGRDNVDGGAGNDTLVVDYSANDNTGSNPKGITSSFNAGAGYVLAYKTASGDSDQVSFSNIENLNITGTKYDDNIVGSTGNDVLKGGAGNDTFYSNSGVDIIDGGDGVDTVTIDISSLTGNNNINLNQSNITLANGTQLLNLEKFNLTTGAGDDTIIGGNAGDNLNTGTGNDTIAGGSGNDVINAGAGNDTINAGLGRDNVDGGAGNDTLVVDYSANDNTGSYPKGISSSFNAGAGYVLAYKTASGDSDQVSFSNIENLNITGTKYDDNIVGSTGNDVLKGGLGNDTFTGNGGIDTLVGGAGRDNFILTNYAAKGNGDYAIIKDFNPAEDRLTLGAPSTEFTVANTSNIPGLTGAAIFKGTDLIAVFEGQSTVNILPIDLAVSKIETPTNGNPGQKATINYTVTNLGTDRANGTWEDTIYLSKDDKWDLNDPVFGRFTRSGGLNAGESYTQAITANLPGVINGDYQVIVRTDIRNNLLETNDTNNTGLSTNKLAIDVKKLVIGTSDTGTLGQEQSVYYRIDVAAGETLSLNFDSQSNSAANELYVRYGDMPTRSNFDYSATKALAPDREVVIPTTKAGTYYVLAYGKSAPASAPSFNIDAKLLDFGIRSISTKSGGNAGKVTIEISGAKFDKDTLLTLADEKLGVEIAASRVDVVDATKIFATFDLKGAKAEVYDLVAKNSSNKVSKLPDSFTITEGGKANLVTNIIAPAAVRTNAIAPITIQFTNTGNVDLVTPLAILTSDTLAPIALKREDLFNQTSLELLLQSENSPAGVLAPGATGSITLYANALRSLSSLEFSLSVLDDPSTPLNWNSYIKNIESQVPEAFTDPIANANFWKTFRSSFGETVGDIQVNLLNAQQLSLAVARREAEISGVPFSEKDYPNISLNDLYSIASFAASYGVNQPVVNTINSNTSLAIAPTLKIESMESQKSMSLSSDTSTVTTRESITLRDKELYDYDEDGNPFFSGFIEGTKVYFNVWKEGKRVEGGTIDPLKKTYIIIHGFRDTGGNPDNKYEPAKWMKEMANSLQQREPDSNVILVDWQNGASEIGVNYIPYVSAANTTDFLGDAVGQYILDTGYEVSKVTLIGHSLGAQTAGDAGEYLIPKGKKLHEIIGLDAAAPRFEQKPLDKILDKVLDKSDAENVIGIHTSLGDDGIFKTLQTGFGFIAPYATKDLYVNPVRSTSDRLLDYSHPGGEGYSPLYDHGYAITLLNRLLKGEDIVDPNTKKELTWENLDKIANYTRQIWDFQERKPGVNLNPKAITENSPIFSIVGTFSFKSDESSFDAGYNRKIEYSFLKDKNGILQDAGGRFAILDDKLLVANSSLLDYEKYPHSYVIVVKTIEKFVSKPQYTYSSFEVVRDESESFNIQLLDVDEDGGDGKGGKGGNGTLPTKNPPNNQKKSPIVRAFDPNDIIGPAGFGDKNWIDPQTLPYTIRFENQASATAPAQTITITNPLDSDLDFGTFRLGSFGWGEFVFDVPADRSYYSQRLDLTEKYGFVVDVVAGIDLQKKQAFWTLTTIDPETGEPPENPLIGFLPPTNEDGIGDGFVNYTINPSKTVKTGDVINAKASIVFDTEAPIDTPPIFNTIDLDNPTSRVQALAANTAGTDINVTWAGTDDGSGVGTYNVYVAADGGAYTLWQTQTDKTSGTYTGEIGKTYSFYSIATDGVGRTEPKTATAETTTQLVAGTVVTTPTITVTATDPEAAETLSGQPTNPGRFTLTRTGATTADLTVNYTLAGTATNGKDYPTINGTATFTAGSNTTSIDINPIDDKIYEGTETVILSLTANPAYIIPAAPSSIVNIADNDAQIPQLTQPQPNLLSIEGGTTKSLLKLTKTAQEGVGKNEAFAFVVDDDLGRIGGIAPGQAGYLNAALDRSQVIFSNLGNNPIDRGFDLNSQRYLNFTPGDRVEFGLVADDSIDKVKADLAAARSTAPVLFSLPGANANNSAQAKFTALSNNGGYQIAWANAIDDGKTNRAFNDMVMKVETIDNFTPAIGTNLQGKSAGEVLDLRNFAGQTLKVDTVSVSDAAYNNYIGFYAVEDTLGTLANGLKVGDAGYAEAAIKSAILRSSKTESFSDRSITGGKIFAPVVIANGTFEDFLKNNPQNQANGNVNAYFNYLGANPDKVDHFRLLGDNKFGIEDLYGGGDRDYNDIVFQVNVKI